MDNYRQVERGFLPVFFDSEKIEVGSYLKQKRHPLLDVLVFVFWILIWILSDIVGRNRS